MAAMKVAIPKTYRARVVRKEQLTPKITYLRLASETPIPFIEGQYASFLIDNYRRPLSFASPASQPEIDFIVDVAPNGVCSRYALAVHIGDSASILAPYGRFTVPPDETRPLLFIAAGSGIAPIRAQLLAQLAKPNPPATTLIFGNKDEPHAFLTEEFTALAQQYPTFRFIPTLSEPSPEWHGERGLVTEVAPHEIDNLPDCAAFVCGSPTMVADTVAMLKTHGVPADQIHTENFA